MKLKVKKLDLESGKNMAILSEEDCTELGVYPHDRIKIFHEDQSVVAIVSSSKTMIRKGEIGIFSDTCEALAVTDKDTVTVTPTLKPESIDMIRKKMSGAKLQKTEIYTIINDIVKESVSEIELAAYLTALEINGMDIEETEHLVRAMVDSGDTIEFPYPVVDVHSVGGVPGNKYALITIPVLAAAGLKVPKTSSRAISSAAGTADVMEVLARVDLNKKEIEKIVKEVGATIVWGGALTLAPADDKIVQIEYSLRVDPKSQLLASVMAKKKAMNINTLIVDIPMGEGTKVESERVAKILSRDFIELGERLGIDVECAYTYGGQPVGRTIGPALEAQEAMQALEGKTSSNSLTEKALELAGMMFELANITAPNSGKQYAKDLFKTGKARNKFLEMINAQGSKGIEKSEDIELGKYNEDMLSVSDGYISKVSNQILVKIARTLGAPKDKGSGIRVYKKMGDKVEKEEPVLRLYSENKAKLREALGLCKTLYPVQTEGMVLKKIRVSKKI